MESNSGRLRLGQGNDEAERTAGAWLAVQNKLAAHLLYQAAANRQAQARTPNFRVAEPSACRKGSNTTCH